MRNHTTFLASLLVVGCSGNNPSDIGRGLGSSHRDAAAEAELGTEEESDASSEELDAAGEEPDAREETPLADAGALMDAPPADATAIGVDAAANVMDASPDAGQDAASAAGDASGSSDAAEAGQDAGPRETTVLSLDFESALPASVDPGDGILTPSQDFAPLGAPGNSFGATFLRSQTSNTVTITLTDLPAHSSLSLAFLFAAIDSLDGTGSFPAGDFFRIDLNGGTIFRESFANAIDTQIQSYAPLANVVLARRVNLGFGGPDGYYTDSAYDLGADPRFANLPHSSASAVLTFTLEGDGVQTLDDESWAIDNLRITLGDTPRSIGGG